MNNYIIISLNNIIEIIKQIECIVYNLAYNANYIVYMLKIELIDRIDDISKNLIHSIQLASDQTMHTSLVIQTLRIQLEEICKDNINEKYKTKKIIQTINTINEIWLLAKHSNKTVQLIALKIYPPISYLFYYI